jgi:hypothetical protein
MDSWVIRRQDGKYLAQNKWDQDYWTDTPSPFGGDRATVESYYAHVLKEGCVLEPFDLKVNES